MPTTFLKNPLLVSGTPAAATSGGGAQPPNTMTVEGTTGQDTTGSGQTAGTGANLSITAGAGGTAPNGSTNGAGGSVTIQPGAPGAGAGTAAGYGNVLIAAMGGYVGIGMAVPGRALDIVGDFRARGRDGGKITHEWPANAAALRMWALADETVNIKTNGVTYFNGGSVGIGTTSPGSKLQVVGGGIQIGTPTGGDQGAGSINIAGDFYKNGTPVLARLEKTISDLTKRLGRLEKALSKKPGKATVGRKSAKPKKSTKSRKSAKGRR